MSDALLTQATHTLKLISGLDKDEMKKLHDGYLSYLALAIKKGTLPNRDYVCRALGLYEAIPDGRVMELTLDYSKCSWLKWCYNTISKDREIGYYIDDGGTSGVGEEVWEAMLFSFHTTIPIEEAVRSIKEVDQEKPWFFGDAQHLLALGAPPLKDPVNKHSLLVVSLGSHKGYKEGEERKLGHPFLRTNSGESKNECRFDYLGIHKEAKLKTGMRVLGVRPLKSVSQPQVLFGAYNMGYADYQSQMKRASIAEHKQD